MSLDHGKRECVLVDANEFSSTATAKRRVPTFLKAIYPMQTKHKRCIPRPFTFGRAICALPVRIAEYQH